MTTSTNLKMVGTLILALVFASQAAAQEEEAAAAAGAAGSAAAAPAAPASPWSGSLSLGYLGTSGNTDTQNMSGSFSVGYEKNKWSHVLSGQAIGATDQGDPTAENYGVAWKTERKLTDPNFVFLQLDYRKDRFSGFPEQFSQTVGYGRLLIDRTKHMLTGEIGVGARQSENADGESINDAIVRGALLYNWKISETAEFNQELVVEAGQENTYVMSLSEIKATIVGDLALVASYQVKHNTDVPDPTENTDTFTALSLEYSF